MQLCGDAHLSNFGGFASPERTFVFDLNDFDETLPGPFEWDVKRLAASFEVAGRGRGFSRRSSAETAVLAAVRAYREAMRTFATMSILDVWYAGWTRRRCRERSSAPGAAAKEAKKVVSRSRRRRARRTA